MKKLLVLFPVVFFASRAHAQGLVDFYNNESASISVLSTAGPIGLMSGANSYFFALFYSTTASTVLGSAASVTASDAAIGAYAFEDSDWTFSGDYGVSTATTGVFINSNHSTSPNSTVNGLAAGTPARFVVLGWSANLGTTLASVESFVNGRSLSVYGSVGESEVSGLITPGNGAALTAPALFGTSSPALPGFTMGEHYGPVPEPATMALSALGALALLCRLRKLSPKMATLAPN